MIGCIAVVYRGQEIVGVQCSKGRGVILPGGAWEAGETFAECAARELREETGLIGTHPKFLFGGAAEDGSFCYAFSFHVEDFNPYEGAEMDIAFTTWKELKRSKFGGYYEILEMLEREREHLHD